MRLTESSSRSSSTDPSRSIGTSSRRSFWDNGSPSNTTVMRAPPSTLMASSAVAGLRARSKLMVCPRLVVALLAQVGHELFELSIDVGLPVELPRRQAKPLRNGGQRHRRVALGDHGRQPDAGPGLDFHDHLVPGNGLDDLRARGHLGLQIPLVAIDAFEKRSQVVEAGQGKGGPELLFDPIAQQAFRHADVSAKDDAPHGAGRHQVVAHGDAPRRAARPTRPRPRTARAP